jgi:hypothetical protein
LQGEELTIGHPTQLADSLDLPESAFQILVEIRTVLTGVSSGGSGVGSITADQAEPRPWQVRAPMVVARHQPSAVRRP